MTQAIVCRNREGLVLATDSCVLHELDGGRVERLVECSLFALGTHAAMLTAGAHLGVDLGQQLQDWLLPRDLEDFGDVLAISREFLAEGYTRYLRGARGELAGSHEVPRYLYFIIGGYSPGDSASPTEAVLLYSEAGELPFGETRLGSVFALPRRLLFESRLTRRIAEGASLRSLAEISEAELQSVAERKPEAVGGPFHLAMVMQTGVEIIEGAG
jgi:hypothetical protein